MRDDQLIFMIGTLNSNGCIKPQAAMPMFLVDLQGSPEIHLSRQQMSFLPQKLQILNQPDLSKEDEMVEQPPLLRAGDLRVSEKYVAMLREFIEELAFTEEEVCQWYNIASLDDMTNDQATNCYNFLYQIKKINGNYDECE